MNTNSQISLFDMGLEVLEQPIKKQKPSDFNHRSRGRTDIHDKCDIHIKINLRSQRSWNYHNIIQFFEDNSAFEPYRHEPCHAFYLDQFNPGYYLQSQETINSNKLFYAKRRKAYVKYLNKLKYNQKENRYKNFALYPFAVRNYVYKYWA